MKKIVGALLACLLIGCSRPHEWPVQPTEELAILGIQERYKAADAEIARITSGDPTKAKQILAVVELVRACDKAGEELVRDVRARNGIADSVAIVRSGSIWVQTSR